MPLRSNRRVLPPASQRAAAVAVYLNVPFDVRIMRSGMLVRHLWRMCFALFIAAGSFFSIRERVAKILPEPFTTGPMRALTILLLCSIAVEDPPPHAASDLATRPDATHSGVNCHGAFSRGSPRSTDSAFDPRRAGRERSSIPR